MMGLGLAFLILLALAGTASAKKPAAPTGGGDLPPVTPGGPDPARPVNNTTGRSGIQWIVQEVPQTTLPGIVADIFLPDGQMGSHPTFRVLRFSYNAAVSGARRTLMEAVPGVDRKVVDRAMSDFEILRAVDPGTIEDYLPLDLQRKLAEVLRTLTVDPTTGKVVGPVTVDAIQAATAFAGELERAGFPAAAATLRAFAKAAATLVASPPNPLPLPGLPADMVDRVNRAIAMERDPAKLRDIVAALELLPQSAARDQAIATLQAQIVQLEAQAASDLAKKKIAVIVNPPAPPSPPGRDVPAPPAPPASTGPNYYTVQSSDGARGPTGVAERFTGNGLRWTELRQVNLPKHDIAKQWWAGMTLVLPSSWPATPGGAAPAPGTPNVPAPAPSADTTVSATYTISTTDGIGPKGPSGLARAKTGNAARWKELIPVNPQKKLRPDGSNFTHWFAGEVINLPQSWITSTPVPTASAVAAPPAPIMDTTSPPQPQPLPQPKSAIEIAADSMTRNLRAVQSARGVRGSIGREDQTLVKRFQGLAGGSVDGLTGPGTLIAAAQNGQSNLPAVMYWPRATTSADILAQKVLAYRAALQTLADQARAAGLDTRAIELEQSLAREVGQGHKLGPVSV